MESCTINERGLDVSDEKRQEHDGAGGVHHVNKNAQIASGNSETESTHACNTLTSEKSIVNVKETNVEDGHGHDTFNCDKFDEKSNVEVSRYSKRKRIHMGPAECFEHAQTEGSYALAHPPMSKQNKSPNHGLYPVMRHKRRKVEDENCTVQSTCIASLSNGSLQAASDFRSKGFVSASMMYDISLSQPSQPFEQNQESQYKPQEKKSGVGTRKKSIKQVANQSSIMNFMKQDTTQTCSSKNLNNLQTNSPTKTTSASPRSVMYSPIKKMDKSACIYISDNSNSPCSSLTQDSVTKQVIVENPVVKKLFEAQKNSRQKPVPVKSKTKAKPKLNPFEMKSIKNEAGKYFLSGSIDLTGMFDSDMEDSEKEIKNEKRKSAANSEFSDKYGLLGSGSYPRSSSPQVCYIENLPVEILENIFCQLPMLDLCLNSNRVCLLWNDIIGDEKFVPWKKLYHKLKKNIGDSKSLVKEMMQKYGMTAPRNFLVALVRYMKDFKPVTATNMISCLKKHKKYHWAEGLLKERLQECIVDTEPNPWCIMTLLVILAGTVYEVQDIINCLTVSSSQCTCKEILECLYCIATFLFAFKLAKPNDVWNGMHYRLFYALYLFENASSASIGDLQSIMSTSKGQQSLVKYSLANDNVRLTHEQLRIVKHQTREDEVIKIVAFAGTGKTTTLVKYTQLRPDKKFLLVVYNKSVCEYAKTKFPRNVECRTGHSLAFKDVGRRYGHKLFGIKVYTLTQVLPNRKGMNLFIRAKFVLTTLENFFASADDYINTSHVPTSQMNEKTGLLENITEADKSLYVRDAETIWACMKDFRDKKVGMSHDGYLKLYQLMRPSLSQYDCILIDEAQDLTPAITAILLHQPQAKILVGDPNQQIYSFRGAVNAMSNIQADTIFYLTQSFRFGPEIAEVAANCLEVLKKEKEKTLVGSGSKCTVMGDQVGQVAIISRCNFTVFSEAVKKCCYSRDPCRVAFVGGTDNFGFGMLMNIYALLLSEQDRIKEGLEITHKLIKIFKNFGDLEAFATKSMDYELLGKIKIVKTYGHNLPTLIRKIEGKCVKDERQADYVFSTAHKAKGMEFSTVRVTDDFLQEQQDVDALLEAGVMLRRRNQNSNNTMDEENLLYVAVTRAKQALQMSRTLLRVLERAGEKFMFPAYSEDLHLAGKTFKCSETDADFKPKVLTLERKEITLGDSTVVPHKLYSPDYLDLDFGSFSSLLGPLEAEKKAKELEQQSPP